jgi:ubiquinone/menaquinone biosynthesis C-methylase UbiE
MTLARPAANPPPNWVESRHPLGWAINRLLAVEPLRQLVFHQARSLIIRTAEGRGIAWRQRREQLRAVAEPLLASVSNPAVRVPDYYVARFHAYNQGNLCWEAACEAEQATDSMALRVWPEEPGLDPATAQERLRLAIFAVIAPSLRGPVRQALDLGCSVGVGTLALAHWLDRLDAAAGPWDGAAAGATPQAEVPQVELPQGEAPPRVEGLDLSPQMLAVAKARDGEGRIAAWHHAAAEATGLEAEAYDLITLQFVFHELPIHASRAVLREAARLLRPGGVIALVDQDPESEVIRRLPAPIATLLKSTEPYLEEYFRLDLPAALAEAGFEAVRREACDPRHRVLVATRSARCDLA